MSHRLIATLLAASLLVTPGGILAPSASTPAISAAATSNEIDLLDQTLDICITYEPYTLYPYDGLSDDAEMILEAVYDGPIDLVAYQYQPVILEQLPTLENGEAITQTVPVIQGDMVVDNNGDVVSLAISDTIRPSGCYHSDCAIVFTGDPVDMDRFRVTFDLLPDLAWSDDTPLLASDSVYSFNLDSDPDTPSGKYAVERTATYFTTSDTRVVWTGLPGYLPTEYYTHFWTPYPEHIWGDYTASELISATVSSRMPLGWGAYVIDEWVAGSYISMHANPNYFRAAEGLPGFEYLTVHFSDDLGADLLAGICDVIPNMPDTMLSDLLDYEDQGFIEVIVSPTGNWEHLDFGILPVDSYTGFSARTHAFENASIRRAFANCLDRQAVADAVYAGLGELTHAYVSPDNPFYPPDATQYSYNPAQGRDLLDAAGWVDTNADGIRDKSGVEFSVMLLTTDTPTHITTTQIIADQMLDNCGIEVTPDYRSYGEMFADGPDGPLFGRQFDLAMFTWQTSSQPRCDLYHSDQIPGDSYPNGWGGQNETGYSNPTFDAACDEAQASLMQADRISYHGEALSIFTQDLPVLPLYSKMRVGAALPQITGFTLDTTATPLWNVESLGRFIPGPVHLPIVLRDFSPYFAGPWEREDNDSLKQANGPLRPEQDYYGYHDDDNDYFSFYAPSGGQIEVDMVTQHLVKDTGGFYVVQMLLYYQSVDNLVKQVYEPDYSITHSGQPGWYYIRIFTNPEYLDATKQYTLQVSIP